ncbi:hypothetical protein [Nocardia xishanensis]|uniref:hypothetical protein n=1 Tax=Nocardia xishanensis TaxID=238964 RepID=UPI0012F488A2|nr:hypothetical protein [Nocardia xishanensis]
MTGKSEAGEHVGRPAQGRGGTGNVVTIAQLRAVLAILRIDPDKADPPFDGPRDATTQRALLVGLLQHVVGGESPRANFAHEDPAERMCADAVELHDRIDAMAADAIVEPAPALLAAAVRSADATAALLELSRNPVGSEAEMRWQRALTDLGQAYHLLNDEYVGRSNTTTAPLR